MSVIVGNNKLHKLTCFICFFVLLLSSTGISAENIESLKKQLATATDKKAIGLHLEIAEQLVETDAAEALRHSEKAYALARIETQFEAAIEALNLQAKAKTSLGEYEKAIELLNKATESNRKLQYTKGQAYTELVYGQVKDKIGLYEDAIEHCQTSYKIFEDIDHKIGMAKSLLRMSSAYTNRGQFQEGLEKSLKSMKFFEGLNDLNGQSSALIVIGNVHLYQGDFNKAIENYNRALEISQEAKNRRNAIILLGNIGSVYYYQKEYEKAIEYYLQVRKLEKEAGNWKGLGEILNNISVLYTELENYSLAKKYNNEVNNIAKIDLDTSMLIASIINKGRIDVLSGNTYEGIKHLKSAFTLSKKAKSKNDQKIALGGLNDAYEKLGQYDSAYYYLSEFVDLSNEMFNTEKSAQIIEMQTKYDVEKKQRDLEIKTLKLEQQDLELEQGRMQRYYMVGGLSMLVLLSLLLYNRYRLKRRANDKLEERNKKIEAQREQLAEKNKDITDSIEYGKTLQQAILPEAAQIENVVKDFFLLFKPRDIVSGDFYWFHKIDSKILLAAADCTGHGVPGAFVSMMGNNLLNQIVIEKGITDTSEILTQLNIGVQKAFKKEGKSIHANDGMDIALVCIDLSKHILEFSGAHRPLILVRNSELIQHKGDNTPIGGQTNTDFQFRKIELDLKENDVLYMFSDGYPDQFGGPKGKKFMLKRLKALLLKEAVLPLPEQKKIYDKELESWMKNEEQVDDILLVGVRPI